MTAIRRPDRIPVGRAVGRHRDRVAPVRIDRPDIQPRAPGNRAARRVRDTLPMRRPARQHRIDITNLTLFARRDVDHPHRAESERVLGIEIGVLRGERDFLAVGRPRRLETLPRQSPDGFAGAAHDEDSATIPARSKRDAFAIGRKRRLIVIVGRIRRQIDGRLPGRALEKDVAVGVAVATIDDPFAVGRELGNHSSPDCDVICVKLGCTDLGGGPAGGLHQSSTARTVDPASADTSRARRRDECLRARAAAVPTDASCDCVFQLDDRRRRYREAPVDVFLETATQQAANARGGCSRKPRQFGSRVRMAAVVSETVSPSNALCPVSISKSTQPNAQMSERLSTGLPRACSGLM